MWTRAPWADPVFRTTRSPPPPPFAIPPSRDAPLAARREMIPFAPKTNQLSPSTGLFRHVMTLVSCTPRAFGPGHAADSSRARPNKKKTKQRELELCGFILAVLNLYPLLWPPRASSTRETFFSFPGWFSLMKQSGGPKRAMAAVPFVPWPRHVVWSRAAH